MLAAFLPCLFSQAGRTMIYITRALGDVFNGTWVLKPNGKIQSAWTAGGAFISFECAGALPGAVRCSLAEL